MSTGLKEFINAKIMQNQVFIWGSVISTGYLSIRNGYRKHCELNAIKIGESVSHLHEFYS